jgi:ankyrin repeat protein
MESIDKKLSVNYNRNQYVKIDKPVEEIVKIEIYFYGDYDDYDMIEDLELEGDENVIIYKNKGNGDEFINIFCKARMMITTEDTINEDKYKKLPENVEYVIVNNKIYEIKDEFEMMKFMSEERFMEYIGEMERHGKINENNKKGETILYWACSNNMERVAMELIPKMSEEAINKWNEDGETALYWACRNKMERVAMELIPRMGEGINKWNKGYTALYWACFNDMEDVAIELIRRMSKKAINKRNNDGYTALYCACENGMERVIELINTINKK